MIYFDWMMHSQFGVLREEIWAFLHFPFHLALVFLVEGTSQFIIWRKVVEVIRYVLSLSPSLSHPLAFLLPHSGTSSLSSLTPSKYKIDIHTGA